MEFKELQTKVLEWAEEKEILSKATPHAQAMKTLEEVNELLEAVSYQGAEKETFVNSKGIEVNTKHEIQDAFGDILVTIIIGAEMQGLDITNCLESAYNVIKNRTGRIVNGQFQKDN